MTQRAFWLGLFVRFWIPKVSALTEKGASITFTFFQKRLPSFGCVWPTLSVLEFFLVEDPIVVCPRRRLPAA